jgi:hypothetical protein
MLYMSKKSRTRMWMTKEKKGGRQQSGSSSSSSYIIPTVLYLYIHRRRVHPKHIGRIPPHCPRENLGGLWGIYVRSWGCGIIGFVFGVGVWLVFVAKLGALFAILGHVTRLWAANERKNST